MGHIWAKKSIALIALSLFISGAAGVAVAKKSLDIM